MRFEIDPAPEETARACAAIVGAALPPSRASVVIVGLYAAVVVGAYAFTPDTPFATVAIGIGGIMAAVKALQVDGRRRVRSVQANDPHARETHFIELGPEGLRAWCDHVDARYPWTEFTKVVETSEFYLFVRASGNGSAIPKRLLDPARNAELRSRIREWSPDHGGLLAPDPKV